MSQEEAKKTRFTARELVETWRLLSIRLHFISSVFIASLYIFIHITINPNVVIFVPVTVSG